eukprot:UN24158
MKHIEFFLFIFDSTGLIIARIYMRIQTQRFIQKKKFISFCKVSMFYTKNKRVHSPTLGW